MLLKPLISHALIMTMVLTTLLIKKLVTPSIGTTSNSIIKVPTLMILMNLSLLKVENLLLTLLTLKLLILIRFP